MGAGVATAFAAKDVMGNMLCGVALQFSRPFSIGDSITVQFIDLVLKVPHLHVLANPHPRVR
jgi:small-conductance mechanosensitive channel